MYNVGRCYSPLKRDPKFEKKIYVQRLNLEIPNSEKYLVGNVLLHYHIILKLSLVNGKEV